ncbi:hypothetical protein LCGC14_3001590, partial [marine sediment metagenome]
IRNLLNMGDVFEKVNRPSSVLIFSGSFAKKQDISIADLSKFPKALKPLEIENKLNYQGVYQYVLNEIPGNLFITAFAENYEILKKINKQKIILLADIVDEDGIQRGVSPDLKGAFIIDKLVAENHKLEESHLEKVLTGGKQVKKYNISESGLLLIYTKRNDSFNKLPYICNFIDQFKKEITCKEVATGKHPIYALHRPRKERIFSKDKKLVGVITEDEIVIALDDNKLFATDGLYVFGVKESGNIYYLMALLNSNLYKFIYRLFAIESGRSLAQVKPTVLNKLPIRIINQSNIEEKSIESRIIELSKAMIELNNQLSSAKMPTDKTAIQRQITATDNQVDQLVYKLYGLTKKEIKIIEESTNN